MKNAGAELIIASSIYSAGVVLISAASMRTAFIDFQELLLFLCDSLILDDVKK